MFRVKTELGAVGACIGSSAAQLAGDPAIVCCYTILLAHPDELESIAVALSPILHCARRPY